MTVIIKTTFHGPTETKGARVIASNPNNRQRVTVGYHSTDGHRRPDDVAAGELAVKLGWTGAWVRGGMGDGSEAYVCLGTVSTAMLRELEKNRVLAFNVHRTGEGDACVGMWPEVGAL